MSKRRFPRSVAKHICEEKARIRRTVRDPAEQVRQITELIDKFRIFVKSK